MGFTLGDAIVVLSTDNSKLNKGLDDAENKSKGFGSRVGGIFKGALTVGALGATAAIGGLAFAFRDSVDLAKQQIEVEKQLDAVIASTGGAAGLTAQQIKDMASGLQGVTNFGDEAIIAGQNLLLTFTNIGADVFPQVTETMLDMSQALGQDMKSSAIQLGKALNDPVKGVTALSRVGVSFTEEQKKMIAAMQAAGDTAGAQKLILAELSKEFGGSARALADPAIQLQNSWGDLKEEVGKAVIPILNKLAQKALPYVIKAIEWFKSDGIPILTEWAKKGEQVFDTIMGVFNRFRGVIDGDVTGRFVFLKQKFDEILPYIETLVKNVTQGLTTFWTNHGETVMRVVGNALQAIQVIFTTVTSIILDTVKLFLQILTGDWEGAGETIRSIVTTLLDGLWQLFKLELDSIVAIFNDIDWAGLGRAIIDGIANGISNAAGRIADAARRAAEDAYNAAKSWLGIRSPSRKAAEGIGVPFAQGIGEGISGGIDKVKTDLNLALGGMMAGARIPTAQAIGGGSPVTVEIRQYFNGNQDRDSVRTGSRSGVLDALRSAGLA